MCEARLGQVGLRPDLEYRWVCDPTATRRLARRQTMPPLVIAYHLILTAYGFWLPNDPRGSWSDVVRSWELLRFGKATKTYERRSLARKPHDRAKRLAAKRSLVREAVEFNGLQARAIANGFADYCERSGLVVHACAIL